tara:strand:+ start:408 stop:734 length:327 start_codon:yes stop_codon:yes gene_type:complete
MFKNIILTLMILVSSFFVACDKEEDGQDQDAVACDCCDVCDSCDACDCCDACDVDAGAQESGSEAGAEEAEGGSEESVDAGAEEAEGGLEAGAEEAEGGSEGSESSEG